MAKVAIEQVFNGTFSEVENDAYSPSAITLPPSPALIRQWNLGAGASDKFLGPNPVAIARPFDQATSIPPGQIHVIQWSATQWWLFYGDNATAAATRRVGLYFYNPVTNAMTWQGSITVTFPTATNFTLRSIRAIRTTYVTGTVGVSGTAVTGSGTAWQTARVAVGSRIGFGSTDPTQISTWYQISAIGSDTGITLTGSAGTITAGTDFVIEELRVAMAATNATATNGGLFVVKGLRIENFATSPTAIGAAVSTDNVRACFWLKDAATVTNTAAGGLTLDAPASDTSHDAYVPNSAASSLIIYRYNLRAALTVASGAATLSGGDLTITGAQSITGTLSQNNAIRLVTLSHGPASGVKSLFVASTTRITRIAVANVTTGNTTFVSDAMIENPPGSSTTMALTNTMNTVDYSDSIDRLIISLGATDRAYVTQYRTDSGQFDHVFLSQDRQLDQSTMDANAVPHPGGPNLSGATGVAFWSEGGVFFIAKQGTTAIASVMYAWPGSAHWAYVSTTSQRAILPEISLGGTPAKFYRVVTNMVEYLGSEQYGKAPDPLRLVYRTSGISDNSGSWSAVPADGDLSGVSAASSIQFATEFKTLTELCLPGRLLSIAFIYETTSDLPSQHRWNITDMDSANGIYGFIQRALFSSAVPTHTIDIYRADTDALVLTQASSGSTNGVFEYWDGAGWTAGLSTDTLGTRRRFRATAGLPSGVQLYAKITT